MRLVGLLGFAITVTLLSLGIAACGGGGGGGSGSGGGGGGNGDSGSFVTPGIDAPIFAAMLSDGTTALVHFTDAHTVQATFRGNAPAKGQGFDFTNDLGDSVTATASGDGFSGTLTVASGDTYDFTMEPVSRSNGGLYRNRETIRGEDWIIGMIVLNDGKIVGSSRDEVTGVVDRRTTLSIGIKWTDPTTDP
jgi:hypothetical protein